MAEANNLYFVGKCISTFKNIQTALVFSPKTTNFTAAFSGYLPESPLTAFMDSPAPRPSFLTTLCFLTFMSSVLGLWNQSQGLWNPGIVADQMQERFEKLYENLEKRSSQEEIQVVDQMFKSVINATSTGSIQKMSIIMVIFESLTLFAAYLMWTLDKRGFYLYLIAIAIGFLGPLLLVGKMLGVIMALAGTFSSFFMGIFYAFNLKHLR
jgi:hypothetical protein